MAAFAWRLAAPQRITPGAAGPNLSADAKNRLEITVDGNVLTTGIGGTSEPYEWTPTDTAAIEAFVLSFASGQIGATSVSLRLPASTRAPTGIAADYVFVAAAG